MLLKVVANIWLNVDGKWTRFRNNKLFQNNVMGIKNWNVGFQQCILGDGCFNEFSIQNECLSKGVPELVNNVDMQRTHDVH